MGNAGKPLIWRSGEIKTSPFSTAAGIEAGTLLRRLQLGGKIGLSHARPLPSIGRRCYELRVRDAEQNSRIVYRIDADAIVSVEVFAKQSSTTPRRIIETCITRLKTYEELTRGEGDEP